jgi:hypothetical protein
MLDVRQKPHTRTLTQYPLKVIERQFGLISAKTSGVTWSEGFLG